MEQRIGFCTTGDGVRIAYATKGEGFPVLYCPAWASHVELNAFNEDTGPFQLVQYDKRGTGLSDRNLGDYSIPTRLLDIEAVVSALGLSRFALYGNSEGGPLAIAYTAAHPEHVARLILDGGFAVGDTTAEERDTRAALVALVRANWGMGSAALTSVFWDDDTPAEWMTYWHRLQREAVTPSDAAAMWQANGTVDVRALLPAIRCPTLVIHGRNDKAIPFDRGRELAAGITNARLYSDEGGHKCGLTGRGATAIQFLLEDEYFSKAKAAAPADPAASGTAVILFADIVDSTAITERIGDAAFHERSATLHASLREALTAAGGRAVEGRVLGDGVMAVFEAAKDAIAAATACHQAAATLELQLHVGVHAGDVIRDGNNVHGGAVNIAARVAGASAPGETLVSEVIRHLARTSAGVTFVDRGDHALKGINEPLRLYGVSAESS
jgi:pimeloyl-ACP methyl ester carboxylesterase